MLTKEQRRTASACLVLAMGTVLLYLPALTFDFVNLDDQAYVFANSHLNKGFSWRGLGWAFQAGYASNWHPLTWLSHMLDCQWFGLQPGGHHAVNVFLHAANSVLLFLVWQRMTKAFWRSAIVAALFAWHPLHVESVAWIAERKDVLSGLFWILAIWAYLNYVKSGGLARYCLVLIFFILGLMSKPMVVTLPLVLLLLDWWPLSRFKVKPPRLILLEKAPLLVLSAGCSVLTLIAQRRGRSITSLDHLPLMDRMLNSATAYLRYAGKIFWPKNLIVFYPLDHGWRAWEVAGAGVLLASISVVAVWFWKTRPYWPVGWFWFLGTLVPVIGLVQVGLQSMADRYTYLPSIGLFTMVCWGICDFTSGWQHQRALAGLATVMALAGCAWATEKQVNYWENSETLYRHALAVDPDNYLAHNNYGAFLYDQQQFEQSRLECQKAVHAEPNRAMGHFGLGRALLVQGRPAEAAAELRLALMHNPELIEARKDLGKILLSQNLPGEAAEQFAEELKRAPDDPGLHYLLGGALARQQKFDSARLAFEEALRLDPSLVDARCGLALTLSMQQKTAEAIAEYRAALKMQPNRPDSLNNLAWILAVNPDPQLRNGPEAVQMAERACALTQYKQAVKIGTLAAAYAEAGRFEDAVACAQKARDVALAHGEKKVAAKNLELLELYKARKPYHEQKAD